MPIETPERSQTLRSTVKSRKTDGSDLIWNLLRAVAVRLGSLVVCPSGPQISDKARISLGASSYSSRAWSSDRIRSTRCPSR